MYSKLGQEIDDYMRDTFDKRDVQIYAWRARVAMKQQRRHLQRKLFGEHYNYSKVGLNKQKKYLLEEQRNTEIQRSNRILLQKIQRISKRSVPITARKRNLTQQDDKSYPSDSQSNMLNSRLESPANQLNKSHEHLKGVSSHQLSSVRDAPKLLFKGSKNFDGKMVLIKTYISNAKFTVAADLGRIKQQICLDLEQYRAFFRDVLGADHSKIVQHLVHNGQILELIGINKQKILVRQRQQVVLPQLVSKPDEQTKNTQYAPKNQEKQSPL